MGLRARSLRKVAVLLLLVCPLWFLHVFVAVPHFDPPPGLEQSMTENQLKSVSPAPPGLQAQVLVVASVATANSLAALPSALDCLTPSTANASVPDIALLLLHRPSVAMSARNQLQSTFPCASGGVHTMVLLSTDRLDMAGFHAVFGNTTLQEKHHCLFWWGDAHDTIAVRKDWPRTLANACNSSQVFWIKGPDVAGGQPVPHVHTTALINWHDKDLAHALNGSIAFSDADKGVHSYDQALTEYFGFPRHSKYRRLAKARIINWTELVQKHGSKPRNEVMKLRQVHSLGIAIHTSLQGADTLQMPAKTAKPVGVSIVSGVHNRNDILNQTLPSWYTAVGIGEVVIVDWGSRPPVWEVARLHQPKSPIAIRVIVVPDAKHWLPSRAANLAAGYASFSHLLKLDPDTFIARDFMAHHPPAQDRFYAGNRRKAQEIGELTAQHSIGIFLFAAADFARLNGYDERLTSSGWQDDDLYERASRASMVRAELDYTKLKHFEHGDGIRSSLKCMSCSIATSKYATERLPPWGPQFSATRCVLAEDGAGPTVCRELSGHPYPLRFYYSDRDWYGAVTWGYRAMLSRKLPPYIDHNVIHSVSSIRSLEVVDMLYTDTGVKYVVIHAQGGLANRVRAYLSAKVFAKTTGRTLIVLWQRDTHCPAGFFDLFGDDEIVLNEIDIRLLNTPRFKVHDFQEWEDERLLDNKHLYITPSFRLKSPQVNDSDETSMLTSSIRLSDDVQDMVNTLPVPLANLSAFVGVHIRMQTSMNQDATVLPANGTRATAITFRPTCHHADFIAAVRKYSNSTRFFVATDQPEHLPAIVQAIGPHRVLSLSSTGQCEQGAARQDIRDMHALANMFLLGHTSRIITVCGAALPRSPSEAILRH
ncbi:hypothetical protein RI367_002333 [Sorochytrium milnesiophthora]